MSRTELEAYWMPFTSNRQFKSKPRLLNKASGMHYWTPDGRKILKREHPRFGLYVGHRWLEPALRRLGKSVLDDRAQDPQECLVHAERIGHFLR